MYDLNVHLASSRSRRGLRTALRALGLGLYLVAGCGLHGDAQPAAPGAPPRAPIAKSDQQSSSTPPEPEPDADFPFRHASDAGPGPVLTPELRRLRALAQARILGVGEEIEDETGQIRAPVTLEPGRENGNELGSFVPIENEAALSAFHAALEQIERRELPERKLRILAYGASHTQGDLYTGYLRYYLQSRFGDAGPGFSQMVRLDRWHRPRDLEILSRSFSVHHAQLRGARAAGWFGLLGAVGIGSGPGPFASLRLVGKRPEGVATEIEIHTMGHPDGGELSLFIDGRKRSSFTTRAHSPEPLFGSFVETEPVSEVSVRVTGSGTVRLFGASVEWATSGVVVDTLGISGTRAANQLLWEESVWAEQVRRRAPQLVLFAYGTNESSDVSEPIEHYEGKLAAVLERHRRAAPEASCLLVGPGDADKKDKNGDNWIPRHRLTPIIEAQRRQAFEQGCGFWDTRAFMGPGGIARWARAHPAMASADRIHLTRRGYVRLGMALGDALLRAYDARWQAPVAESPLGE